MSYSGSDSIGLLMPYGNSYNNYPGLNPSFPFNEELSSEHHSRPFWTPEISFPSRHQSDGDPIGDNSEGEQTYHSFGYLLNELDSTSYSEICRDLFFNCPDPCGNQNGCRMENSENILHNEDYNGDSRNLGYECACDWFQSWFGLGEDEHGHDWSGQELKLEHDCSSDAMALLHAILGY